MKRLLIILTLGVSAGSMVGQDAMFSQYAYLEQQINSAMTGRMDQDYRAAASYRNQWSTITEPFRTMAASYDMPLLRRRGTPNFLGVGGMVLSDKAGTASLRLFEVKGAASYHVGLNDNNMLGMGLQVGYSQRSINIDGLAWDSQYNGIGYDPTIDHGETIAGNAAGYVDVGGGMYWHHYKKLKYTLGYATKHYRQNQSFIKGKDDKLIFRHVFHGDLQTTHEHFDITYRLLGLMQGGALELMGGAEAKYLLGRDSRYTNNETASFISAGCYYRVGDAIIPTIGYEYQRMLQAFITYDFNISKLNVASNYRGAWEITLIHRGWLTQQRRRLR
jgi:type IX secretion system PorP/SprF family membrane protein